MESSRGQDQPPDRAAAPTAALAALAEPGIRFTPGQFALGTIVFATGLVFCVHLIFGSQGLAKAWWPLGLFFTLVFLYPWAVVAQKTGWFALIEVIIFFFILFMGFLYAHKKGALKWV